MTDNRIVQSLIWTINKNIENYKVESGQTYPAFLLWNSGTLSLIDNATILGRNILANLLLNSVAFILSDNFTLGLGACGTFFLHHRLTLILKPCRANLIILNRAFLFMSCVSGCSWNIDAFEFWNIVTFFILNSATLGAGILSSLALASELGVTLLARDCLLYGSLGDLTLSLLDVSTNGVRNCSTLLPCDGLECRLGHLIANFLGNLATVLWWRSWRKPLDEGWCVELLCQVRTNKNQRCNYKIFHAGWGLK